MAGIFGHWRGQGTGQGAGEAANAAKPEGAAEALVKDATTASFAADVIAETGTSAGAGRLLGALVRTLQAARASSRKNSQGGGRQGQARQDESRRASGNTGPAGGSFHPRRHRLSARVADRRFHGRLAGIPVSRASSSALPARSPTMSIAWPKPRPCSLLATPRGGGTLCRDDGRKPRRPRRRGRIRAKLLSPQANSRAPGPFWPRLLRAASATTRSCAPGAALARRTSRRRRRCFRAMRKIAADAGDHQARFDSPFSSMRENQARERAAELVESSKRGRAWNDDGTRSGLLQFFDAWGAVDPGDDRRKARAFRPCFFLDECNCGTDCVHCSAEAELGSVMGSSFCFASVRDMAPIFHGKVPFHCRAGPLRSATSGLSGRLGLRSGPPATIPPFIAARVLKKATSPARCRSFPAIAA